MRSLVMALAGAVILARCATPQESDVMEQALLRPRPVASGTPEAPGPRGTTEPGPLTGLPTEVQPVGGGGQIQWLREVDYEADSTAGEWYVAPSLLGPIEAFQAQHPVTGKLVDINKAQFVLPNEGGATDVVLTVTRAVNGEFVWRLDAGPYHAEPKPCVPEKCSKGSGVPPFLKKAKKMLAEVTVDGSLNLVEVQRLRIAGRKAGNS